MNSTRRSSIWFLPVEELRSVVKDNNTFSAILRHYGIYVYGNNQKTLQKRLDEEKISYDHIEKGINSRQGKKPLKSKATPLKKVLTQNSSYARVDLKRRLITENVLKNECVRCGLGPIWNGEKLSLQIDHINGIKNDNRLRNLRLLCPNCHSQTPTFGGRNVKNKKSQG